MLAGLGFLRRVGFVDFHWRVHGEGLERGRGGGLFWLRPFCKKLFGWRREFDNVCC